jgi:hypothetical protein
MGGKLGLHGEGRSADSASGIASSLGEREGPLGISELQDRRLGHRCSFDGTIYYAQWSDDRRPTHAGKGRILDLSGGGARIRTDLAVPVNSSLDMIVTVEETLFRAKGRVVHQGQVGDGQYQVRACFDRVDAVGKTFLLELV